MAKKFLVNLDLNGNELQNAVFQNLATAPSDPKQGQFYYNTTNKKFYVFEDDKWSCFDSAASMQEELAKKADKAYSGTVITGGSATELAGAVSEIATQVNTNTAAITTLNGDASTTGSVAKSIADKLGTITSTNYVSADATVNANISTLDAQVKSISESVGDITVTVDSTNGTATVAKGETTFTTYTKDKADSLLGDKADKATTLSGYGITDAYTKTEVDAKVSSVYRYKGSVATVDDLPTEGNVQGDVYNVQSTGDNYAWVAATETEAGYWDKLGGTIDLSDYYTKDEVDTAITTEADRAKAAEKANADAIAALLPSQTDNANKALVTDGTTLSWKYTTLFKDLTKSTEQGTDQLVINKLTQEEYDAMAEAGTLKDNELYITTSTKETYSKTEVDALIETEKTRAETAEALAVLKTVATNPALTVSGGIATWEVSHTYGDDVEVTIKEVATGEEVFADVAQTSGKVTVKMNSAADIAEGVYKIIIMGVKASA